jgi:hypothetical protein
MYNFDPSHIAVLEQVRKTFESIPERFRKEMPASILVRVIAQLVPGVKAVDGSGPDSDLHTWLRVGDYGGIIIDVLPTLIFPGPVLLASPLKRPPYTNPFDGNYAINTELTKNNDAEHEATVAKIVDATEGTKRFLGMP